MTHENEDAVPVLNSVVESGNESIIQSSRLGREVLRELEALQQTSPVKFVLHDHILGDDADGDANDRQESQLDLMIDDPDTNLSAISSADENSESEIELMIDEVVDRHITELRKDIRRLLLSVKQFS